MKRATLFAILLLAAASQPMLAEPAVEAPALTPAQKAFLNIPEEERQKYTDILNEAIRFFHQQRIIETLEKLSAAKQIFDSAPEALNIEASCYVEIRDFDRALEIYKKAEEISPDNPSVKFNIAEIHFVTHQWQEAHDRFSALLTLIPAENVALSRLSEFKILLAKKKLGREEEFFILANKYDFTDDSPFYYFAQAVLAFDAEDLSKAQEWMQRAARVFRDPSMIAPFQDALVECGYIKSFYGSDPAAPQP